MATFAFAATCAAGAAGCGAERYGRVSGELRAHRVYRCLQAQVSCFPRFPSSTLLPFFLEVPSLKPNSRKKGTLIMKGLLGNLDRLKCLAFNAWGLMSSDFEFQGLRAKLKS